MSDQGENQREEEENIDDVEMMPEGQRQTPNDDYDHV